MQGELEVVNVRLTKERSLYSDAYIKSSEDAVRIVSEELANYDREAMCIINLNSKSQPICLSIVSVGTLNYCVVSPREIFKASILANAAAVIAVHNHPSGHLEPSNEDILMAKRLNKAGNLLGIKLVDFVICGEKGDFLSFHHTGMMEELSHAASDWER